MADTWLPIAAERRPAGELRKPSFVPALRPSFLQTAGESNES